MRCPRTIDTEEVAVHWARLNSTKFFQRPRSARIAGHPERKRNSPTGSRFTYTGRVKTSGQGRLQIETKAERKLWVRLLRAWKEGCTATNHEYALQYTFTYPDNVWGWMVLADVLVRLAQYETAHRALSHGEKLASPSIRRRFYIQRGNLYAGSCDLQRAEKWFRRSVAHEATTPALTYLGEVLAKQGRLSEAKQCHRRAIRLATCPPAGAYYNLGLLLHAERRYPKALECFDRTIKIDPDYELAKGARKKVMRTLKSKAKGKPHLGTKAKTKLWETLWGAWKDGNGTSAIEIATQYTTNYPDDAWGWIVLADIFVHLTHYQAAHHALSRAERLAPAILQQKMCVQWGHRYKDCDLQKAEHWYRRALEFKATTPGLIFVGAVLAKQGRYPEAKRCHRRAVRLDTDELQYEACFNLGLILRAERRYSKALECFERAIQLHPNYQIARDARIDVMRAAKIKSSCAAATAK